MLTDNRLSLIKDIIIRLSIVFFLGFVIVSCKKDSNDVPNNKYTVYTAGFIWNNGNFPCYWKGTSRTDLPGGIGAFTTSIFVSDGIVYTAGYYINSKGRQAPCYWKGIEKINLSCDSTYDAYTTSIFVSNGNVYTAGHYMSGNNGLACYWVNLVRKELEDNSVSGKFVSSIYVVDTTVYLGGYRSGQLYYKIPCYWIGNRRTDLSIDNSNNGKVSSIYISNGTFYTCGSYGDNGQTIPCYWVGSVKTDLETVPSGNAKSICVEGGIIYTFGFYSSNGRCYWKGTSRTILNNYGESFYLKDGTVFSAGSYYKTNPNDPIDAFYVPCYWIGNTKVDLPIITDHNHNSTTSIFVE